MAGMGRGVSLFKPKPTEELLSLLGDQLTDAGGKPEPAEQTNLLDAPGRTEEPRAERGPDELYELLTSLVVQGYEFRIGGTEKEPKVQTHPYLELEDADFELFKANKKHVLAWVREIEEMRAPRRRLKAGVRRWLNRDLDSREWVLGFWDRPDLGQGYVRGQLWQVVAELDDLGVTVRPEERQEVLPLVVMEVAADIARQNAKMEGSH